LRKNHQQTGRKEKVLDDFKEKKKWSSGLRDKVKKIPKGDSSQEPDEIHTHACKQLASSSSS